MAVYVDWLRPTPRSSNWPFTQGCHLIADTLDELHTFAAALGMRREWFQNGSTPHYDLSATRQKLAIAKGAVRLRNKYELVPVIRRIREALACSSPS